MIQDKDLAWLAGIWDGEGSILLNKQRRAKEKIQITPCVYVGNTDILIMNKVRKILQQMDCSFHWQEKNLKSGKVFFVLQTTNLFTIQRFLTLINPFLVGTKQAYGETTLSYVSNRIAKAQKKGVSIKNLSYDEEDFSYVETSRSSTTTREAPIGEDIVYS